MISCTSRILLVLLAGCLLVGCATAPYTGRSQFITMSEPEERRLGLEAARQVLESEEEERGTARARRVVSVGRRIAEAAERPDFEWEFHTLKNDALNAFCLPGGKVFVYTGLLDLTRGKDGELAAVIGHEVGHVIARHAAERVSLSTMGSLASALGSVAVTVFTGNESLGELSGSGFTALTQVGFMLPYSRSHESEADSIGLILAAKAGYDPAAAVSLWEKMAAVNKGQEGPAFLSTHPLSSERIKAITAQLPGVVETYGKTSVP